MRFVALDPGEKYCGLAWFQNTSTQRGWRCINALTLDPDDTVDLLWEEIAGEAPPDLVVMEEWRNRPGEADWSTCVPAEVIGAVRHQARRHDVHIVTQPSRIMVPCAARLRRRKIQLVRSTDTLSVVTHHDHTTSAQLHGWYKILRPV